MQRVNDNSGVSVIICCYNSAARLSETLKHIALQKVPADLKLEVIIVDNNSTDATVNLAKEEWTKYEIEIPFTIVHENQQGLSFARKKGVETASYGLLIFCDDDNWLQEEYIVTAHQIMIQNANIGIAGGYSAPYWDSQKPTWCDHFPNAYAIGKQMPTTGYANERGYLVGAGMVIRKSIFNQLDVLFFSSILSDRKGKELSSGGDSELCLIALYLGHDLYYDERLRFTHYIPAARLTWKYCVELISKGFAIPQIYFYMYDYCYHTITDGKQISFEYTYQRNWKKPLREIKRDFKDPRSFLKSCKMLLFSEPGSKKEIELKARINKLKFTLTHKQQLKRDFDRIAGFIYRLTEQRQHAQYKTEAF